jgi:hypothetical protein
VFVVVMYSDKASAVGLVSSVFASVARNAGGPVL